jgi:hypothetical protein
MILHKKYVEHNGKTIKFTVTFNREKTNWATCEPRIIGYQVTVVPIKITRNDGFVMEEFTAFSGFNDNLLPASRQSAKRLSQALLILSAREKQYLQHFENK